MKPLLNSLDPDFDLDLQQIANTQSYQFTKHGTKIHFDSRIKSLDFGSQRSRSHNPSEEVTIYMMNSSVRQFPASVLCV